MIKTMLTKADLHYLLTQQEKLDKNIREKLNISEKKWRNDMTSEHSLAIEVEVSEFINECHDLWKYWKSKPVNKARIIEEGIDVIHFLMLHYNKESNGKFVSKREVAHNMHGLLNLFVKGMDDLPVDALALEQLILKSDDIVFQLYVVLKVLDHYGFTAEDIISEYNTKNKENFRRIETGY